MEIKYKFGFPFNKHPIEGIPTGSQASPPSGLTEGYYIAVTASATPPLPTDVGSWTATNKADDGTTPDHTTAVDTQANAAGDTNYIHVMRYIGTAVTWTTYTMVLRHLGQAIGEVKYSANGSAWATWDSGQVEADNNGVLAFVDYSRNPADQSGIAVCASYKDSIGIFGTPPCQMDIYEFIPAHA